MPVLPVIHATNEDSAKTICKTGFATLCALDAGTETRDFFFLIPY
jgi:hypothetical protein